MAPTITVTVPLSQAVVDWALGAETARFSPDQIAGLRQLADGELASIARLVQFMAAELIRQQVPTLDALKHPVLMAVASRKKPGRKPAGVPPLTEVAAQVPKRRRGRRPKNPDALASEVAKRHESTLREEEVPM